MTLLGAIAPLASDGLRVTESPRGLAQIHERDCAAVLWKRDPASYFTAWLDDVSPARLPRGRLILRVDAVQDALTHLCNQTGLSGSSGRDMLIGDIAAMTDILGAVMDTLYVRLHLESSPASAARPEHADADVARLICGYCGPEMGYGPVAPAEDAATVGRVPNCAPVLFRGPAWPPLGQPRFEPRSSSLGEGDAHRLVLVLDPVIDTEAAAKAHVTYQ